MSRLIDANALLRTTWVLPNRMTREMALECFRNILNEAPTIDAEPVRHGRWIKEKLVMCEPYYTCSECGKLHHQDYNFCNNCGAKMDGGADNA